MKICILTAAPLQLADPKAVFILAYIISFFLGTPARPAAKVVNGKAAGSNSSSSSSSSSSDDDSEEEKAAAVSKKVWALISTREEGTGDGGGWGGLHCMAGLVGSVFSCGN